MNVRFMKTVGTRPEHRGEAMTGAIAQLFAKRFCKRDVRKVESTTICEDERAKVERIAFAVFAGFRARDAVALAAFEIVIGFDSLECRSHLADPRCGLVTDPGSHGFGEFTTEHRRRFQLDA